jgi:hypothetical protein
MSDVPRKKGVAPPTGKLNFIHGRDVDFEAMKRRRPEVTVDAKWITIVTEWHRERGPQHCYDFRTERCATPLELLGWVCHLSIKVWADGEVLRVFAHKVCAYYGWKMYGGG